MHAIEFDSSVEKIGWFSWVAMVVEYTEYEREGDSPFAVRTPKFLGIFRSADRAERAIEEYLRGVG